MRPDKSSPLIGQDYTERSVISVPTDRQQKTFARGEPYARVIIIFFSRMTIEKNNLNVKRTTRGKDKKKRKKKGKKNERRLDDNTLIKRMSSPRNDAPPLL